jgi:hypothetical protein
MQRVSGAARCERAFGVAFRHGIGDILLLRLCDHHSRARPEAGLPAGPDDKIRGLPVAAMTYVIYLVSGIFILLAAALVFAYYRMRHAGLLLMASTYASAAVLALMLMHWWPLVAGFVLAWVLRLMGMDPRPDSGFPPARE